jgi:hypothetical protein
MGKPQSYIAMMVQRQGEDWLLMSTPENIQNSFKRIVKDIVRGIIDYEAHGKYFLDPKFMENLIIAISNELEINTLNLNSCRFYYSNFPQTPNLATHVAHLESLDYIYRVILERLYLTRNNGNIGYMTDLSGILFNYRNHLN